MTYSMITVKAERVHDNHDGTFTLEVLSRDLSSEEQAVLDSLFPDLESAVGKLLQKQALMGAIK